MSLNGVIRERAPQDASIWGGEGTHKLIGKEEDSFEGEVAVAHLEQVF